MAEDDAIDPRLTGYLAMCQAVGHIVVEWALIERQIDNWTSVAFKQCGGSALRKNGDIPGQFKQKRAFLTECFKTIPVLADFKDEGLDLLHRASNVVERRHDLIHGTIVDMVPTNGIFKFHILKTSKDHHVLREFDFD